jgi:hypothetical protein
MSQLQNLNNYTRLQRYYSAVIIVVSICLCLALLFDLYQIHIYRHDSGYYIPDQVLFDKLEREGRWLNFLIRPVYSLIPGRLVTFLVILSLFIFVFIVCNRWSKNASYALLIALLCIQAGPLMVQIMWPTTIVAAYLILLSSVFFPARIPVYWFYSIYGVLLFGTMSNVYYLLPLVHFGLLAQSSLRQNIKVLFLTILPAWALGFIVGYLSSNLAVYILSDGETIIKIAEWRQPNYINSFQDFIENVTSRAIYLYANMSEMFSGIWRQMLLAIALLLGVFGVSKTQYLPMVLLSLGIIVVHYVVTIPVGIVIQFRTCVSVWLGVIALLLFYPQIKKWQYNCALPVILFLTLSFYAVNHQMLKWYSSITNTYYDELIRSIPLSAELYNGVAFLSSSEEMEKTTAKLGYRLNVKQGSMENLSKDYRWQPIGFEAGFKRVFFCAGSHKSSNICKQIANDTKVGLPSPSETNGLYRIHGEKNGYLVVSLNDMYF